METSHARGTLPKRNLRAFFNSVFSVKPMFPVLLFVKSDHWHLGRLLLSRMEAPELATQAVTCPYLSTQQLSSGHPYSHSINWVSRRRDLIPRSPRQFSSCPVASKERGRADETVQDTELLRCICIYSSIYIHMK